MQNEEGGTSGQFKLRGWRVKKFKSGWRIKNVGVADMRIHFGELRRDSDAEMGTGRVGDRRSRIGMCRAVARRSGSAARCNAGGDAASAASLPGFHFAFMRGFKQNWIAGHSPTLPTLPTFPDVLDVLNS